MRGQKYSQLRKRHQVDSKCMAIPGTRTIQKDSSHGTRWRGRWRHTAGAWETRSAIIGRHDLLSKNAKEKRWAPFKLPHFKQNGPFARDLISLQVASPRKTSCPWLYSKFEFRALNLNGGTKIKPRGRKRDPHKRMQGVGKQSTTGMDVKSRLVGPEGGLGGLRWI